MNKNRRIFHGMAYDHYVFSANYKAFIEELQTRYMGVKNNFIPAVCGHIGQHNMLQHVACVRADALGKMKVAFVDNKALIFTFKGICISEYIFKDGWENGWDLFKSNFNSRPVVNCCASIPIEDWQPAPDWRPQILKR